MALKTGKQLTDQSVTMLQKFQSGQLQPIKTGKDHLDESLLGGLLPSTVLGICARPAHGKTYDLEEIERHVQENYPDVIMLKCAWEMEHFKLLVRDLSAQTGKKVKDVLFRQITNPDEHKKFKEICDRHRSENIFWQDEPVSDDEFEVDVETLIKKFPYNRIMVSIDNLENVLNTKGNQKASMDAMLYKINRLKKIHNFICFIVLNQLNGDYLNRMDDIKRQKPIDTDIYGSEQLLKLCDVIYVKMLPWKLGIKDRFMVFGRNQYDWLEEHKTIPPPHARTVSFDPFGKAFYFYLKVRQPEDEKKPIRDVFIETLFTREDAGYTEYQPDQSEEPSFEKREVKSTSNVPLIDLSKPASQVVAPNFSSEDDDDEPF